VRDCSWVKEGKTGGEPLFGGRGIAQYRNGSPGAKERRVNRFRNGKKRLLGGDKRLQTMARYIGGLER